MSPIETYQHFGLFAFLSLIAGLLFIVVLMTSSISQTARLATDISLLAMLGIIYLVTSGKGKHDYFLYLQMGYFTAFFLAVLLATYL